MKFLKIKYAVCLLLQICYITIRRFSVFDATDPQKIYHSLARDPLLNFKRHLYNLFYKIYFIIYFF